MRGLLHRLAADTTYEVSRELPFDFHVNPDAVVVDGKNRVALIGIVAYWNHSGSSEKKYYRTRSEYEEATLIRQNYSSQFSSNPQIVTVLYGAAGGWKEKVLDDVKEQCSPCLFLPDLLGKKPAAAMVDQAFRLYKEHWEAGGKSTREYVESFVANKPKLTAAEKKLLAKLKSYLDASKRRGKKTVAKQRKKRTVRLPSESISTRYRQPLGLLSLFPENEIEAWQGRGGPRDISGLTEYFARRAWFLDLVAVEHVKSILDSWFQVMPKAPYRYQGERQQYAPDLLDFVCWESLDPQVVKKVLKRHRGLTADPGTVFKGGAFDQVAGNWRDICAELLQDLPQLFDAVANNDLAKLTDLLVSAEPVKPEAWHPASGSAQFYPLWAFVVCAIAISEQKRTIRSQYGARRQESPSKSEANEVAKLLLADKKAQATLAELAPFLNGLLNNIFDELDCSSRPALLSLDEPCSWVSDLYNTLTTNSSHNPIVGPIESWLKGRFPGHEWFGWPDSRSVSVSSVLDSDSGRRQWQIVGKDLGSDTFVAGEVKSITGNNWGNKSKELYDRVAETRRAARSMGYKCLCIGVLDGDIGPDQFKELRTGIGYDEVFSISEIIAPVATKKEKNTD